jgi:hypothetical protein
VPIGGEKSETLDWSQWPLLIIIITQPPRLEFSQLDPPLAMSSAVDYGGPSPLSSSSSSSFSPHLISGRPFDSPGSGRSQSQTASTSPGGLPPMVRRVVSKTRLASRPGSASPLATTQELKLARTQNDLRLQSAALQVAEQEIARARTLASRSGDRPLSASPVNGSAAAPSAAIRDLGPLYSQFQLAAQQTGADLANGFPGSITTAFERTSYWKRAPPTQSNQLGTIAWLFLHYALPRIDMKHTVTTVKQLESPSLRLTWRQWDFFCRDWQLVPQITSKVRTAALYQRFGIEGSRDVGMTYISFVKCLAILSMEAYIVPRKLGVDPSKTRPTSAATLHAKAASQNGNASDKCHAFLKECRLNDMEYVASGLESLERTAWYRVRAELTDAKSVYVHKPSCLQYTPVPSTASPGSPPPLRASPCTHAHPPKYASLEKKIIAGVSDPSLVLHLNPHAHESHGFGKAKAQAASEKKAVAPSNSSSSASLQEEKTNGLFPVTLTFPPKQSSRPSPLTSNRPSSSPAARFPSSLTAHEQIALGVIRKYERLPLEDFWCAYPGAYVDMGVIEVLPALEASSPSKSAVKRDPSEIVDSKLRPHRYTLELKNRCAASLKVTLSSDGCDWMEVEWHSKGFLALGMSQKLGIRGPTHMPYEDSKASQVPTSPTSPIGQGVEKMGFISITVENAWTYEVSRVSIPVYARLVLKNSTDLTSIPKFVPSASTPMLMSPATVQRTFFSGTSPPEEAKTPVPSTFSFTRHPAAVSGQHKQETNGAPVEGGSSDAGGVEPDERDWQVEDEVD